VVLPRGAVRAENAGTKELLEGVLAERSGAKRNDAYFKEAREREREREREWVRGLGCVRASSERREAS